MPCSAWGAWGGLIGAALFVGGFTIEGWIGPGYGPVSNFISALSLGPRVWALAAGVTMAAADVVLKIATLPPPAPPSPLAPWAGLIQRVAIVSLTAWVASVGQGMLRAAAHVGQAKCSKLLAERK